MKKASRAERCTISIYNVVMAQRKVIVATRSRSRSPESADAMKLMMLNNHTVNGLFARSTKLFAVRTRLAGLETAAAPRRARWISLALFNVRGICTIHGCG